MEHKDLQDALLKQGKTMGLKKGEMNVLATDPFFVGSPKDYEDAQWAAKHWDMMMSKRKKPIHLRGFHYWMQSNRIVKPDGNKYTEPDPAKDWGYLLRAAQMARYLGIGEWNNLMDLKHPDPKDYDNYYVGSGLTRDGEVDIQSELDGKLEGLVDEFINELLGMAPRYSTDGYQVYHLEVWCEKNSMGFVIEPQCRKYNACYQALVGQSSVEKVNMSFERALRAARAGKAVRIFYISDWDRYGMQMIPAVARKIEFFKAINGGEMDIKLTRLALSEGQINLYNLPKAPKHGEAVVELDALEAIHPGELGKIVGQALSPYYDDDKPKVVEQENRRMRDLVRQMLEEKLRQPLTEAFKDISLEDMAGELDLAKAIDPEFEPPEPGHAVGEDDDWVYSSDRDYWEQFNMYLEYKGSRNEEEVE